MAAAGMGCRRAQGAARQENEQLRRKGKATSLALESRDGLRHKAVWTLGKL